MRDRVVAVRYAQALLDVAVERQVLDSVCASLATLAGSVTAYPDLRVFMQSPQVPTQDKKALIHTLLDDRVDPVLVQFLELLLDKDRILFLGDINEEFATLVERHRGLQRAAVVTAVPLAADLADQLTRKLEQLTRQRIILDQKVDPSVIGGICVTMGDRILDGTLRTGLAELRRALEHAPLR
ncbi:MAG TPA: ATP synthase F1 subunit delta [Candidatus Krumholzibacteria bacterium]|nr:ATP synthase F1 subunit delta [Candidatus Krumholzibacteria bacterium]HPD73030.1 ATP synthase F1 subunit delta [Candidatus Krumholzibacteria bacterium]HRY41829.1 ATP synthase F1 subunit delta [Candidatus Krumholzibacteria bacterium]